MFMENFKTPVPVDWQNQRVLTTTQLADVYKCTAKKIKQNFNNNKERFVEGKHYFKLEGDVLKKFRSDLQVDEIDSQNLQVDEIDSQNLRSENIGLQISSMTRTLYLWTERGAARHAKMLSTEKAWEVFEMLEDNYFNRVVETAPVPAAPVEKTRSKLVACVYILLLSSGLVKIGHTDKVGNRATVIERETNSTVGKLYCTFLMARDKACSIERICQKNFSSYRVNGEFFNADFSEVRNFLKSLVEIEVERNNGLLKIADMMDSSPERQALLIQAANFYVGKILV